ncbi:TIGR00730 family Rossman fold protein [Gammaproteobacteria bacterium]|nr:TIGR00730 family Rossman fold protein [Gammaproteobacteria bacterium]MDA7844609.1 TIGR00730 family Rossman fold protein [Gammaproteobacteria bacterium]MDA8955359.1 TIGR00730 family Rossman fold protein [Gammaproteobacteria bacterium]MDB4159049.1 TIGR00730 family Rossman fold protein [Gammaproteobacteria bacterium]
MKNISVFCGAHLGNNPIYAQEAKKMAELMAKKGINVVFGGGEVGLMGVVSNTAMDNGADAIAISLKSLVDLELVNPRVKEVIITNTLLDRKDEFMERSDAFIVLPGGVGSLDELAEIMASNQLGLINKPVALLNTAGYYDHLIAWMEKAVGEGFISQANFNDLIISDSCEDLLKKVINNKRPSDDDWTNRIGL